MEVHIFDVEHGNCAAIISPAGRLLMIDCGHNDTTGWRPSAWVKARGQAISCLTITNFDDDHVSDLPDIDRTVSVESWVMNWHVTSEWLRREKAVFGMGPGVTVAARNLAAMREMPGTPMDWGAGFDVEWFYHPVTADADENYLSVVTFVHCGGIRLAFGGDLTAPGWRDFLGNAPFRAYLAQTNIFVASHHGREDGYYPGVFDYCKPAVVIISDKSVQYDTQLVDYGKHAAGVTWNQTDRRYCLTTRKDGKLTITPRAQSFHILATS